MASKALSTTPKTVQEFEDFAYALGEHCLSFSDDIQYKIFVQDLIKNLVSDLTPEQTLEIANHTKRLAEQRAKGEKAGDVEYHIKRNQSDDSDADSDNEGPDDLYIDFM
ncbi:hypothetical protein GPJ56_003251 [Histomonas meleagridis]|uniref:uncharacterized protein n=1 Tax=Histomonas meleagridis TaxID=135588 RepID=UPI00355A8894|nr:hypothetical protein GPJ56_003251 [Histomonas meleagridis]KAH0802417.1 hypothetical protein GO595_004795 [Histomonas meleagridis]